MGSAPYAISSFPARGGAQTSGAVVRWRSASFSSSSRSLCAPARFRTAINKYKYQDKTGWASIFGRVLVGYMDEAPDRVTGWNAIVPSPTYIGEGSRRSWDHIALILEKAKIEAADRWPQLADEPGLIVKTADTPSMMGKTLTQRRQIAETDIRSSLHIPDPARVVGRSFLVFDDVFTDGSTLREIARALLAAGATEVGGLVLARQPWTF